MKVKEFVPSESGSDSDNSSDDEYLVVVQQPVVDVTQKHRVSSGKGSRATVQEPGVTLREDPPDPVADSMAHPDPYLIPLNDLGEEGDVVDIVNSSQSELSDVMEDQSDGEPVEIPVEISDHQDTDSEVDSVPELENEVLDSSENVDPVLDNVSGESSGDDETLLEDSASTVYETGLDDSSTVYETATDDDTWMDSDPDNGHSSFSSGSNSPALPRPPALSPHSPISWLW